MVPLPHPPSPRLSESPAAGIPTDALLAQTESLHDLLSSPGWAAFMLPLIGRPALELAAARTLDASGTTPEKLHEAAIRHRCLNELRQSLDQKLQHQIQQLHRHNALSDRLLAVYQTPKDQPPSMPDDGLPFDPFGAEPPPS